MNINKDTIVAIFLLLFCGIMINNSFQIEDPGYQGMKASFWPTVILYLLSFMSFLMFIKSVVYKTDNNLDPIEENTSNIFLKFKNPLICFFMFILFLTFLDYLGMLIAGILFVFGLLTLLGGSSPKKLFNHFIISIITIGIMWSIFTFGLKVILPEGELLRVW
jgi:putative tricarboxylic transport membrane protein